MTAISDHACQVDGCEADAAELIMTDDDELVLLCRDHHDVDTDGWRYIAVDIKGRTLLRDDAWSWFFLPEGAP